MAVSMKFWKDKFSGVDERLLAEWLSDMFVKGVPEDEQVSYIQRKYDVWKGESDLEEAEAETDTDSDADAEVETELEEGDVDSSEYGDEIYEDNNDEGTPLGEIMKKSESKQANRNNDYSDEPDIPFENPDLSEFVVPDDPEEEDIPEEEEPAPKKDLKPFFIRPRDEMITKRVSMADYEQVMVKPFAPILDSIKFDKGALRKLASNVEINGLPPYMQYKPYIINHPIKDVNNTYVSILMISETNPSALVKRSLSMSQAVEVTKLVAEQGYLLEGFSNYEEIVEVLMNERMELVSLIFILENYAETKQVVPFELSVPKKILVDSIDKSFKEIEHLITKNVITQLSGLRGDLQSEMGSVGTLVEKNMARFDSNIQEAVTKVLWKVKTDVESTNFEDIKRSLLWLNNKRAAAYRYGAVATAVMSVMLNDLEALLIEQDFMFDKIKKPRVYAAEELKKRLFYRRDNTIMGAIPELLKANLIKVYKGKTFSLSI